MKGRKPHPTHLSLVKGGRHAGRRQSESRDLVAAAPEQPAHLRGAAREMWKRLLPDLVAAGLMTEVFGPLFEAYCTAYGRYVEAEWMLRKLGSPLQATPNGYEAPSQWLVISNKSMEQIKTLAAELGLSPTAIARAERLQLELFETDPYAREIEGAG